MMELGNSLLRVAQYLFRDPTAWAEFVEILRPKCRAAASTLTAMTAADPVASRLLDRTGVCGGRWGTLSRHEKVTGRAIARQIGPTGKGDRYADCWIRTGFDVNRRKCYTTRDRQCSSGNLGLETNSSLRCGWPGPVWLNHESVSRASDIPLDPS